MGTKIQHKRDNTTNWTANNPVILEGEFAYDTTTKTFRIGDGTNTWSALPEFNWGTMYYVGTWDASTAAYPTNPEEGQYYVVSVAGTVGAISYAINDWVVYNGLSWIKITNSTSWGSITGTLSSQTDLITAFDKKLDISPNVITVGTDCDFASMTPALASITDASASNRYTIIAYNNVTDTSRIEWKSHVDLIGINFKWTIDISGNVGNWAFILFDSLTDINWNNVYVGTIGTDDTYGLSCIGISNSSSTIQFNNVTAYNIYDETSSGIQGFYIENSDPTLSNCTANTDNGLNFIGFVISNSNAVLNSCECSAYNCNTGFEFYGYPQYSPILNNCIAAAKVGYYLDEQSSSPILNSCIGTYLKTSGTFSNTDSSFTVTETYAFIDSYIDVSVTSTTGEPTLSLGTTVGGTDILNAYALTSSSVYFIPITSTYLESPTVYITVTGTIAFTATYNIGYNVYWPILYNLSTYAPKFIGCSFIAGLNQTGAYTIEDSIFEGCYFESQGGDDQYAYHGYGLSTHNCTFNGPISSIVETLTTDGTTITPLTQNNIGTYPGSYFTIQDASSDKSYIKRDNSTIQFSDDGTNWYNANTQADWNEAATTSVAYINNKPALGGAALLNVGTTTGTVCAGNDSRLSDARTPISHDNTYHSATYITTTGVTYEALNTNGDIGSSASTLCAGNDSRLSDARTPTSHTHGNITNAGSIGSTATLPIITTTSGVLTVGSFGTSAGTFCQGNDSRLSNARTPTSHASNHVTGGSDVISNVVAAGNAGLMTGADKTRLDGMATGATIPQAGSFWVPNELYTSGNVKKAIKSEAGYHFQNSDANGDYYYVYAYSQSASETYIDLTYTRTTTGAIFSVLLNGTSLSTGNDSYNSSINRVLTSISITSGLVAGWNTIKLLITGRNASNTTGYALLINGLRLR